MVGPLPSQSGGRVATYGKPARYPCAVMLEEPFMGSDALGSIIFTQSQIRQAQALYARELGGMMAANLDGEPPPDAPDASPVEARVRRFG